MNSQKIFWVKALLKYLHFKDLDVHFTQMLQCLKIQFRGDQKRHFIVWSGLRRTEILLTNVLQQRNLDQISISMLATIAINSEAARYMGKIFFIEKTGI